jgi:hypothetical protein
MEDQIQGVASQLEEHSTAARARVVEVASLTPVRVVRSPSETRMRVGAPSHPCRRTRSATSVEAYVRRMNPQAMR